jgi:hypothetical protein
MIGKITLPNSQLFQASWNFSMKMHISNSYKRTTLLPNQFKFRKSLLIIKYTEKVSWILLKKPQSTLRGSNYQKFRSHIVKNSKN